MADMTTGQAVNPRPYTYTEVDWMQECKALVLYPEAWDLLDGWQWTEAYEAQWSPATAVRLALVDCLAPTVGEVTYP